MDERNELRVENEELKEKLGKSIVSDEARDQIAKLNQQLALMN